MAQDFTPHVFFDLRVVTELTVHQTSNALSQGIVSADLPRTIRSQDAIRHLVLGVPSGRPFAGRHRATVDRAAGPASTRCRLPRRRRQGGPTRWPRWGGHRDRRDDRDRLCDGQHDPEDAAFTGRAGGAHGAPHRVDELPGQPEITFQTVEESESIFTQGADDGDIFGGAPAAPILPSDSPDRTSWMVDAALHGSGKVIFAAQAPADLATRRRIEAALIFRCQPEFCVQHRGAAPSLVPEIEHRGDVPNGFR